MTGTRALLVARVSAVVTTTLICTASFVLSFAALWDLATLAGLPDGLSWLWPVIVDGAIMQATISVVAVAPYPDRRGSQRFFWSVLIAAASVSVAGNALHAFIVGSSRLNPALAAAIATVAPISLLAATHGLALLIRVPHVTRSDEYVPGSAPDSAERVDTRTWNSGVEGTRTWLDVAARICDADSSGRRDPDQVALILTLKHDGGWSCRRIGQRVGAHHSTVARIIDAAREYAQPRSTELDAIGIVCGDDCGVGISGSL